MALKALLFPLAFMLLASTTKVTSKEDDIHTEHQHHAKSPAHAPVMLPVHSPKKAPFYPPWMAPVYPPKKATGFSPKKAPIYPPKVAPIHPLKKAPAYPPKTYTPAYPPKTYTPTHNNHGNCVPMCMEYCKRSKKSKRICQKICVPCCDHYHCVPGPNKKCAKWDKVWYHGEWVSCPKITPTFY